MGLKFKPDTNTVWHSLNEILGWGEGKFSGPLGNVVVASAYFASVKFVSQPQLHIDAL